MTSKKTDGRSRAESLVSSMTGFASHSCQWRGHELMLTARSVNSLRLDIRVHIPQVLQEFESQLKDMAKKVVARGTIDINLQFHLRSDEIAAEKPSKNELLRAKKLGKRWQALANSAGLALPHFPIHQWETESQVDLHSLWIQGQATWTRGVRELLDRLKASRLREGSQLRVGLIESISQLGDRLNEIRTLLPYERDRRKKLLAEKLTMAKLAVDEPRLAQELLFYLERADVSEEMTRLFEHMIHFQTIFKKSGPKGRELDFYCQELLRETNTLGAKTANSEITRRVVAMKLIIESLREQVQNLE